MNYLSSFEIFKKRTNDKAQIRKYLNKHLISNLKLDSQSFRVLDIGCSDGLLTLYIINLLKKCLKNKIILDLVESDKKSVEKAYKRLKKEDINVNFYPQKFEDFVKKSKIKYDFVFASHFFYYVNTKYLKNFYNLIKPKGKGLIIISEEETPVDVLNELLNNRLTLGQQVIEGLRKLGLKENKNLKLEKIQAYLALSKLMKNNQITQEGRKLVSFICNKKYSLFNKSEKILINEFLKKHNKKVLYYSDAIWVKRD